MKKYWTKIASILVVFLASFFYLCVLVEIRHLIVHGHLVGYGLHVDASGYHDYIGMPGQTTYYYAEISNYTFWPEKMMACDYITDAFFEPGTEYPYAVQRWSSQNHRWETIIEPDLECFCRVAPLSKLKAELKSKYLLPGVTVRVMDWEETGAREPFRKGDLARFVVFRRLGQKADWETAIPSTPFVIEDDVVRDEGPPFRVKH